MDNLSNIENDENDINLLLDNIDEKLGLGLETPTDEPTESVEITETEITVPEILETVNDYEAKPEDIAHVEDQLMRPAKISNTKSTKAEVIESVLYMSQKTGIKVKEEHQLSRMTKPELLKLLGHLMNNGINEAMGNTDEHVINELGLDKSKYVTNDNSVVFETDPTPNYNRSVDSTTAKMPTVTTNNLSLDAGALGLFRLNKLLATTLSTVNTNMLLDYTGVEISGYTDALESKKEELLPIYRDIFKQYQSEISTYMSPINMLIIINTQCIGESVTVVAQKKS